MIKSIANLDGYMIEHACFSSNPKKRQILVIANQKGDTNLDFLEMNSRSSIIQRKRRFSYKEGLHVPP